MPRTPAAAFARFRSTLNVRSVGVAYAPVGSPGVVRLGDWVAGPAWSTMKVPLAVAALRQSRSADVNGLVHRAVSESDNQAAEALWSRLGSGRRAATAVDRVLADHGDRQTRTQAERVRPQFTPFGQTQWSLQNQVTVASRLLCSPQDAVVVREMSHVSPGQKWGLGRLPGATFKGGWRPDPAGRYLVRQFGVVTLDRHQVAVAVAVEPKGGSFGEGTRALDQLAAWLQQSLRPTSGGCSGRGTVGAASGSSWTAQSR